MAGSYADANDATIRYGFQHVRPALFIQDALFYLCALAKLQCEAKGIEVPEPPDNPGAGWVIEQAEAFFGREDDEQDPEFKANMLMGLLGGLGEQSVNIGGRFG